MPPVVGVAQTAPEQNAPAEVVVHGIVPTSLPKTRTRSYTIYGIPTYAFCQVYQDRIVVGVTQLPTQHIGSWVMCQAVQSEINPKHVEYNLSTVLGGGDTAALGGVVVVDEKEIYARRIMERILENRNTTLLPRGTDRRTVLLGITLLPLPKQNNNNNTTVTATSALDFTPMDRFQTLVEVLVQLVEDTAVQ